MAPEADYQAAVDQIRQRTAIQDVYTPDGADAADSKVDSFLQDGLTVEEAVGIALLNNRRFQSLWEEIGVSRAGVVQSGLLANPSLGLSIRFPEGGGRSNLSGGFAQQIVDLWQIPIRRKIAEAELERTIWRVVGEALALSATVKSDYFQLAALLEDEQLTQENRNLVGEVVESAKARFEAGEVAQVDVSVALGGLLEAEVEVLTVERDRKLAESALVRDLGLSGSGVEITLSAPLRAAAVDLSSGSLVQQAMQQRVDARAAASLVRAAEAEIRRQQRSIFPSVAVGLEAERPERRSMPGRDVLGDTARASVAAGQLTAPDIQSRAQRDQERRQIIDLLLGPSLDITLPLWDQNQAQIAKARFVANQRRKEFEDLLDSIAQEVEDAVIKRDAAHELVEFYEKQGVPHGKEIIDAARAAYMAGEEPMLVLLQAQQLLNRQQRAEVAAMRDLAQASAELERAIGGFAESPHDAGMDQAHGG